MNSQEAAMKPAVASCRFIHVRVLTLGALLLFVAQAYAQINPLPSWTDSPAKKLKAWELKP
jgi:hypothetical protein